MLGWVHINLPVFILFDPSAQFQPTIAGDIIFYVSSSSSMYF